MGKLRYKSIGSAYSWTANKKKMCNYGSVFASFILQLRAILFPSLSYRGLIFWGVGGFNGGVSAFRARGAYNWRGLCMERLFFGILRYVYRLAVSVFMSLLFYSVAAV